MTLYSLLIVLSLISICNSMLFKFLNHHIISTVATDWLIDYNRNRTLWRWTFRNLRTNCPSYWFLSWMNTTFHCGQVGWEHIYVERIPGDKSQAKHQPSLIRKRPKHQILSSVILVILYLMIWLLSQTKKILKSSGMQSSNTLLLTPSIIRLAYG